MSEQPTDGSQAIIRLTERQYDALIRERNQLREQLRLANEDAERLAFAIIDTRAALGQRVSGSILDDALAAHRERIKGAKQ